MYQRSAGIVDSNWEFSPSLQAVTALQASCCGAPWCEAGGMCSVLRGRETHLELQENAVFDKTFYSFIYFSLLDIIYIYLLQLLIRFMFSPLKQVNGELLKL